MGKPASPADAAAPSRRLRAIGTHLAAYRPHRQPSGGGGSDKGVALVTGGSRGIGAATCTLLAEAGYAVAVNFVSNQAAADDVVSSIVAGGGTAIAVQADMSKEDEVVAMFARIDEMEGALTAVVNNAAIIGPKNEVSQVGGVSGAESSAFLNELGTAEARTVLDANVIGPLVVIRCAMQRMSTSAGGAGGAIVNVSSGAAYVPNNPVLYSVSK